MQRKNNNDIATFQSLPKELQHHVFSFFKTPHELNLIALINKECHQLATQQSTQVRNLHKEQYGENIFYTIGCPINVGNDYNLRIVDEKVKGNPSTQYDFFNRDIYESFRLNGPSKIKLFLSEKAATDYAEFYAKHHTLKAPVFSVLYLGDKREVTMQDHHSQKSLATPSFSVTSNVWHAYFETHRAKVLPLTGTLTLWSCVGIASNVICGQIDYDHLHELLEKCPSKKPVAADTRSSLCRLM